MSGIDLKETEKEVKQDESSLIITGNEKQRQAMEVAEEAREKEYLNPSFAGKMFMGDFDPSMLFPFPQQDPEDKRIGDEFIDKLTTFLTANLDPEEVDASRTIPKDVIDGMVKMGVFAMKIPKEYGGLGFSQTNYNRVVMKVASYCGSTAVLISAHQSIGVPQPLKMFGTEEQKKKFYPRFSKGSISAFALTESNVGSDPAEMNSEAKLSDDGSHYILNGEKLWCTNGTIADIIVVMAKTPPKIINGKEKKQISAFLLEMNTPGVEVTHRCNFMGLGGIYNGVIRFTNVKIPKENILWAEGRGLAMALSTINVGRLTLPAACTGAAKQCLHIVRKWGNERIQWGMPIGLHEAGKNKIAFIAATTLAMEAITWLTSSWVDKGGVDIRIEAAMAKMFCTESFWKIVDMTMQLRGGRGYEKASSLKARGEIGYPVERMMRDSRINMILEGSTEIMKLFLAREAMDPHLKLASALLKKNSSFAEKFKAMRKIFSFYSKWYPSQFFKAIKGKPYPEMGQLASHFSYVDKTSHKLARSIFYYMAKYKQGLEKKQMILGRLIEIGTDLFAMSAVCSYAASSTQGGTAIELADYFCKLAEDRIKLNFESLEVNIDSQANQLAKDVLVDKFLWLEEGVIQMK